MVEELPETVLITMSGLVSVNSAWRADVEMSLLW